MLILAGGDYELELAPSRGGAVLRFEWRGRPLLREAVGPSIFDTASFPLVPFSNRIAHGRFSFHGQAVRLEPNFPGTDHPHPLHGLGWLAQWSIAEQSDCHALLVHEYAASAWPWPYIATQRFELGGDQPIMTLTVTNQSDRPMPVGLGFHPYFPRDPDTRYLGHHVGEWQTASDGLPRSLDLRLDAIDWWHGQPVACRSVDTVFAGRRGPIIVEWPSRGYGLELGPSDNLDHTVIYSPAGADFFCAEPVTHRTDAFNPRPGDSPIDVLQPGESLSASLAFRAFAHR